MKILKKLLQYIKNNKLYIIELYNIFYFWLFINDYTKFKLSLIFKVLIILEFFF